jgi:hypothetical protein
MSSGRSSDRIPMRSRRSRNLRRRRCTRRRAVAARSPRSLYPLHGAHLYNFVAHGRNHSTCRRSVHTRTNSWMLGPDCSIVLLHFILTFTKDQSISWGAARDRHHGQPQRPCRRPSRRPPQEGSANGANAAREPPRRRCCARAGHAVQDARARSLCSPARNPRRGSANCVNCANPRRMPPCDARSRRG